MTGRRRRTHTKWREKLPLDTIHLTHKERGLNRRANLCRHLESITSALTRDHDGHCDHDHVHIAATRRSVAKFVSGYT